MMEKKVSIIVPTMNREESVISCIQSVFASDYGNIEVIAVDNYSADNTTTKLEANFGNYPNFKLIKNKCNLGAGGGRNAGARAALGEYLLFVDDDNVIDNRMITNLADFFETHGNCGMAGPLMFYKDDPTIMWLSFADINMYSSRAVYKGLGEKYTGQLNDVIEVGHLPNCFMVRREDFNAIGGFDEKFIIMFEEADFAERLKNELKKKVYIFTKALTFHDIEFYKKSNGEKKVCYLFKNNERAFLTARNRVYFMKKNASTCQFILFAIFFHPLIFIWYEFHILKKGEFKMAYFFLKGSLQGFLL